MDVGSSRVNAVLAKNDPSGKIEILRLFQSGGVILPEPDLKALWRKILGLAKEIISEYAKSGLKADEALIVFSSPWYFSEIKNVERHFDRPTAITEKDMEDILSGEQDNFKKRFMSKFGPDEKEASFAVSEIMGAKLNGYTVRPPKENMLFKPVRTFSAGFYFAAFFAPAVSDLKRILSERGIGRVEFRSSPEAIFGALSLEGLGDILVVDVGGEITDIIIIRDGEIKKITSFGRGLNYVARRMAPVFNIGLEETMAVLSNYIENKLDAVFRDSVHNAVKEALKEWQDLVKEALEKQPAPEPLPSKFLVTGHGGGIDEFKKVLNESLASLDSAFPSAGRFKNADHLNKPHLSLIKIYLTYAQQ